MVNCHASVDLGGQPCPPKAIQDLGGQPCPPRPYRSPLALSRPPHHTIKEAPIKSCVSYGPHPTTSCNPEISLPPSAQVYEPDDVWDPDMLFTSVASELYQEKERAENPSDTDGVKESDQQSPFKQQQGGVSVGGGM